MSVYCDNGQWRYRRVIKLPEGSRVRISGTPDINSENEAGVSETEHVARELRNHRERAGRVRRERLLGPYEQHNGWRVVEIDATGKRSSQIFATEEKARGFISDPAGYDADAIISAAEFTPVELSRYEAAARRAGVTLREFIIGACDAVVAYEAEREFGCPSDSEEPF